MERTTKPLKPKLSYSQYSINRLLNDNKLLWLMIKSNKGNTSIIYGNNHRYIKNTFYRFFPSQKIITVKKLK